MRKLITLSVLIFALTLAANAQTSVQKKKQILKKTYKKFVENDFVTRRKGNSYYVNPIYWRMFNAKQKENAVLTLARYHGYIIFDTDNAAGIYIKSNQSAKTLATYGVWEGVEIK